MNKDYVDPEFEIEFLEGKLAKVKEVVENHRDRAHMQGSSGNSFWDLLSDLRGILKKTLQDAIEKAD